MESRDYASDSDTDDEDFVPTGAVSDDGSVSDVSAEGDSVEEDSEDIPNGRKRKKGSSKSKKRKKKLVEPAVEEEKPTASSEVSEEERKRRAESLWADFLSDVGPRLKNEEKNRQVKSVNSGAAKSTDEKNDNTSEAESNEKLDNSSGENKLNETKPLGERSIDKLFQEKENTTEKTEVEVFQFAGETVKIEKKACPSRGIGGVSSVLGQLKGKGKLSTLEKSKLDWESFKAKEGITEDIRTHNKGKQGYLERQDFLERADLRQFEIEKGMRAANRRTNR